MTSMRPSTGYSLRIRSSFLRIYKYPI